MREIHSGDCDHTDTTWLTCDDESCEPHDFQICRDCGEDVDA
jgi:hypothetical protein